MPHSVYHGAITLMSRVWCLAAPASVNFGEVCVQSVNEHKVNVINNLDWFIHFVLKVRRSHDSVLMLPFSCSHRPGVCVTRPNCKARSDTIWDKGLAVFHILTTLNYLSTLYIATSVLQWAGWATVTYGRVGNLKTWLGKIKEFFGAQQMFADPGLGPCRHLCDDWPKCSSFGCCEWECLAQRPLLMFAWLRLTVRSFVRQVRCLRSFLRCPVQSFRLCLSRRRKDDFRGDLRLFSVHFLITGSLCHLHSVVLLVSAVMRSSPVISHDDRMILRCLLKFYIEFTSLSILSNTQ